MTNKKWYPEPYLRINIPKKNGELRKLGLLTIRDKIVQQAIKSLIEHRFEKIFVPNSYGYRPEKGHTKAVKFAKHCCGQKDTDFILRLDIDNYFDTIDHNILFKRINSVIADDEIVRLISLCVKMGVVTKKLKWDENNEGVPQGAILSPILANFYLHPFDQFVLTKTKNYVRYADDFIIFCKTEDNAKDLLEQCSSFLTNRLNLKLNEPEITSSNNGIEFLGILLKKDKIEITNKKLEKLRERIKELSWSEKCFSTKSMKGIKGINTYYAPIVASEYLEALDNDLIQHLKSVITSNINQIASQRILETALKEIKFFSEKNNIERNQIIKDLIRLYSETKLQNRQTKNREINKKIIDKRKREYRQKENEASELIVDTFGTYIGIGKKGIILKVFGKIKPLKSIGSNLKHITIMSNGVTVSSNLLNYCLEKDISIDFFSQGQNTGSFLSNSYLKTSLWKEQMFMPLEKKIYLAKKIIYGKVKNQINLIKYFNKYHKENYPELLDKYNNTIPKMEEISEMVKSYSDTNENYNQDLMGYESSSAILYWDYIRELLKDDSINFIKRERFGATDTFNSLLNYGYSILYSRIWQQILKYRMNPTIGVIHSAQGQKQVFAYDIIEIFRSQCVDRVVISLIQKGEPLKTDNGKLTNTTKKLLVKNILERMNRYETYRMKEFIFSDIIKDQIRCIAEYIKSGKNFKPYIAKW